MRRVLVAAGAALTALCWGCAAPRQRRARALRAAQAKLGHFPKRDFTIKFGDPRQCRLTWTGENCEFYHNPERTEMIWIDFDHDGYSTGNASPTGY